MQWQTKIPLIAILRGVTPEEALAHVGAVINAGFDVVEIPLNSPRWQQSIPAIVEAFGEQALIGAGTVLQPEQVDELAKMGCRLIVTPNIQADVIHRAVGYAVGGVTPENLSQWIDAGCAGAGLGSDLYRAGQSVERTAQQATAFVKAYREAVQ